MPVFKKPRVLIVESDEECARQLLMLVLFHRGDVQLARNAEQALQISAQWEPDLIFIDLGCCDFDGSSLRSKLHQRRITLVPLIYGFATQPSAAEPTMEQLSHQQSTADFDFIFNYCPDIDVIGKLIESFIWKRFQE